MGFFSDQPDRSGIAATVGKIADGFSKLVTQHITLAKLELAEDAKAVGRNLGRMALFVPFVLVGYALLCGALAMVLARWIGVAGGLAVVGAANVLGGGYGIHVSLQRLRAHPVMDETMREFNRSAAALGHEAAPRVMEDRHA